MNINPDSSQFITSIKNMINFNDARDKRFSVKYNSNNSIDIEAQSFDHNGTVNYYIGTFDSSLINHSVAIAKTDTILLHRGEILKDADDEYSYLFNPIISSNKLIKITRNDNHNISGTIKNNEINLQYAFVPFTAAFVSDIVVIDDAKTSSNIYDKIVLIINEIIRICESKYEYKIQDVTILFSEYIDLKCGYSVIIRANADGSDKSNIEIAFTISENILMDKNFCISCKVADINNCTDTRHSQFLINENIFKHEIILNLNSYNINNTNQDSICVVIPNNDIINSIDSDDYFIHCGRYIDIKYKSESDMNAIQIPENISLTIINLGLFD